MMTVREVAQNYGVSDAFMIRALDRIGFANAKSDTGLPTPTVTRFEATFGEKIRAARPKPSSAFTAESDATPTAARRAQQPKPHVMRVAHAAVTGKRDQSGHRVKALLDNPGTVHAIDAAGTWDGDPWSGEVVPSAVHFYGGPINSGPFAACGYVKAACAPVHRGFAGCAGELLRPHPTRGVESRTTVVVTELPATGCPKRKRRLAFTTLAHSRPRFLFFLGERKARQVSVRDPRVA
jgi:hypothetical protein